MTTKQLMNFDFEGFLDDLRASKVTNEMMVDTLVMLLNAGYDLENMIPFKWFYELRVAIGEIKEKDGVYYACHKGGKIDIEDLKKLSWVKVHEEKPDYLR